MSGDPTSTSLSSPLRRARRTVVALVAAALGAGAAVVVGACGEDREGSVENIGGGTTGTGATAGATTGATTAGATTGGTTTGATTDATTEATEAE